MYARIYDLKKDYLQCQKLLENFEDLDNYSSSILRYMVHVSCFLVLPKVKSGLGKVFMQINHFCSDFRYESNGIFVLGVGFFFKQISTF